MNWLDTISTCSDVYIYQASLICKDCAIEIMQDLTRRRVANDGDSDTYPQGPYGDGGGEADAAQFCDNGRDCANAVKIGNRRIGCPLGNPLTSDGSVDLMRSIGQDMFSPKKFGRLLGRLLYRMWGNSVRNDLIVPRPTPPKLDNPPPSLKKLVKKYELERVLLCDPENAYLVGRLGDEVHLLRAPVDEDGEFEQLDAAAVPPAAVEVYDLEKLLAQAVADGDWD